MKVFNINPQPKPRMVKSDAWSGRKCVADYWRYKDELNLQRKGFEITNGMDYMFIMPMPKSWSNKKKLEMNCKPHQQKPDLDNLIKALWDCLLVDDSIIWHIKEAKKIWGNVGKILISPH